MERRNMKFSRSEKEYEKTHVLSISKDFINFYFIFYQINEFVSKLSNFNETLTTY